MLSGAASVPPSLHPRQLWLAAPPALCACRPRRRAASHLPTWTCCVTGDPSRLTAVPTPAAQMASYNGGQVCEARALTRGSTCADWCAERGKVCYHAQDNIGSDVCAVDTHHDRQSTAHNGCDQIWGDQICGCGLRCRSSAIDVAIACVPAGWFWVEHRGRISVWRTFVAAKW